MTRATGGVFADFRWHFLKRGWGTPCMKFTRALVESVDSRVQPQAPVDRTQESVFFNQYSGDPYAH